MIRLFLALALASAALVARAQSSEVPGWFAESFLEFPQDAKEAAQDGKRLMLYFWQDGCPYCRQLTQTTLADPAIVAKVKARFVAVALDVFGEREVQWFDGRRLPEKALARALGVRVTPTLVFLDEKGAIVLRTAGYLPPDRMGAALDEARPRELRPRARGQHARDVHRLALRAVLDLVAAAGAVGDDQRVGRGLAHRGQQVRFAHLHRHLVVLGLVAEAARHAAAGRFDRVAPSAPAPGAGRSPPRPWRRRPSGGSGRAAAPAAAIGFSFSLRRPASASLARNSSNRKAFFASASVPGSSTLYSSRRVSRQDGSSPSTGTPRATQGASAASMRCASTRASSTRPADRNVRPQHSGLLAALRLRDMHAVARGLQHADRGARVLGLEIAVEGIHQQHHFALAALRPGAVDEVVAPPRAAAGARRVNPANRPSHRVARFASGARRAASGA